ncbi:MAG: transcriptional repressor [Proteobacteria bacterium]|nr:transcriptional repressor [Pseudomonadota bacterium]
MTTRTRPTELSPHSRRVLELLTESDKPLTAYDILAKLRDVGIKAPPTVYRALDALIARGLVHRVESINAFVACHEEHMGKGAYFAVCTECGGTQEVADEGLSVLIEGLASTLHFHLERGMLELQGLCAECAHSPRLKASA